MSMDDPPEVTILLLGDASCGKSTLLSRISLGKSAGGRIEADELPVLRDADQPYIYEIRLYNRMYRPDLIVFCFDVNDRDSLVNAKETWYKAFFSLYESTGDAIATMLLGLKRDLRVEKPGVIYPQEGLRIAQEMRCNQYAECSAITGELVREAFEDIAKLAAKTTTPKGAIEDTSCTIQ